MASTLVQFRADSAAKDTAIGICEKLGLDLQSYLRMCISRLIMITNKFHDVEGKMVD